MAVGNWVLVTPHQGLGDHLLCNGLYRQIASRNTRVLITVKRNYYPELSNMLSDVRNISLIKIPNYKSWKTTRFFQMLARLFRIKVLGLGSYGQNFFPIGVRFDNNFYDQAMIDFRHRWDSFSVPRRIEKELEIFDILGCVESDYIFLHEDDSRNFVIDRALLPKGYRVITPLPPKNGINLVDYRLVIERAFQIHVIESSFAAFIESIPTKNSLFAHRYARHHALNDFRHEFTYRKNWTILT